MSLLWIFDETVQPTWAVTMEARINHRLDQIMALVQVEQDDLDALDAALDDATASISARIDALVAAAGPLPPAELTALQDDVAALRSLSAPTPPTP